MTGLELYNYSTQFGTWSLSAGKRTPSRKPHLSLISLISLRKRELLDQVRLFGTVMEVLKVDIGAEGEDIDRTCRKFHSKRNN
jgi:hypothetical protein